MRSEDDYEEDNGEVVREDEVTEEAEEEVEVEEEEKDEEVEVDVGVAEVEGIADVVGVIVAEVLGDVEAGEVEPQSSTTGIGASSTMFNLSPPSLYASLTDSHPLVS